MCDEDFDDCLVALEFIPNWLVRSNILESFYEVLFANDDVFS